jgi:hypothetical protein
VYSKKARRREDNGLRGNSGTADTTADITAVSTIDTIATVTPVDIAEAVEDIYGYHRRLTYHLSRIEREVSNNTDEETVRGFINALFIHGIKIGRVVTYAQFSYEVLKIMKRLGIEKRLEDLAKGDMTG